MKQFDVVKLKNNDKAIIKKVINKKEYLAHIINDNNNELKELTITNKEIEKVLYPIKQNKRG